MLAICLPNPVIEFPAKLTETGIYRWDKRQIDEICVLDVDYDDKVSEHSRQAIIKAVRPFTRLTWHTKNGARGICFREQVFDLNETISAHELAACGAFAAHRAVSEGIDHVELITITRTPAEICTTHNEHEFRKDDAASNLLWWREGLSNSNLSEDEINEWLAENGFGSIGSRFDHTHCPIDPVSTNGNPPVAVTETGIRCYRCDSVLNDGFRSFNALIRGEEIGPNDYYLRNMVRNYTHWGHAKYVLKHHIPCMPEDQVKLLYSGSMKLACNHVLMWGMINNALAQEDMPRTKTLWLNTDFSVPIGKGQSERVKGLPACKYLNEDEKIAVSNKRHYILMGNDENELTKLGYYGIRPVGYVDLGRPIRAGTVDIIAQTGRFQYIKTSIRKSRIDYWQYLSDSYPSINCVYIKILICAIAYSQAGQGEPPQIICVGPSGAGKTQTPEIVCELIAGKLASLVPTDNLAYLLQQIVDNETATMFSFDEIFKKIFDPNAYIQMMNQLKPGAIARKLYVGMVPIQNVSPIVMTDITIPDIFRMNEQISRRSVMVNLLNPAATDWRDTSGGIQHWAKHPLTQQARDCFLSEMLDMVQDLWDSGCNTFVKMAKKLGGIIGSEHLVEELNERITKLLSLWKEAPDHASTRYPAASGWKLGAVKGQSEGYSSSGTDKLGQELKDLISDLTGNTLSDILTGEQLVKLLDPIHARMWVVAGTKYRIEVRVNKRQAFVRFTQA